MTLEQALSRQGDAVVLEADDQSYRKVFSQMLASMQGVSDRVERSDLGVAYAGLDGLEDMYGGEARLVNSLLNAAPQDLTPRVGVAHAKFPALRCGHVQYASWSDQGSRRRRFLPCAPLHRPPSRRLHGEGCHAPLRTPRSWVTWPRWRWKRWWTSSVSRARRRGTCAMALTTAR